tara:strand:- start:2139 stop:3059 length:921 start_codon:yes stop_codon:yes gene_type:complete
MNFCGSKERIFSIGKFSLERWIVPSSKVVEFFSQTDVDRHNAAQASQSLEYTDELHENRQAVSFEDLTATLQNHVGGFIRDKDYRKILEAGPGSQDFLYQALSPTLILPYSWTSLDINQLYVDRLNEQFGQNGSYRAVQGPLRDMKDRVEPHDIIIGNEVLDSIVDFENVFRNIHEKTKGHVFHTQQFLPSFRTIQGLISLDPRIMEHEYCVWLAWNTPDDTQPISHVMIPDVGFMQSNQYLHERLSALAQSNGFKEIGQGLKKYSENADYIYERINKILIEQNILEPSPLIPTTSHYAYMILEKK